MTRIETARIYTPSQLLWRGLWQYATGALGGLGLGLLTGFAFAFLKCKGLV